MALYFQRALLIIFIVMVIVLIIFIVLMIFIAMIIFIVLNIDHLYCDDNHHPTHWKHVAVLIR